MTGTQPEGAPPPPEHKKDLWDIIDILLKGVLAVGVSAALAFYSYTAEDRRLKDEIAENKRAEENRKAQTLIQLINARESADTDLRAKMFQTLMQHYFDRDDIESQIVVLELIGLNFRDSMQIKPMFEQLDRQLARGIDDKDTADRHILLRNAASAMINDQLRQIDRAKDGHVCLSPILAEGDHWIPPDECLSGMLKMTVDTVAENYVEILPPGDGAESFTVSYYDMPMVDFTEHPDSDSLKYSVVLMNMDADAQTIELALALLPLANFNSQHDAYQFDSLLDRLLLPPDTGPKQH